MALLGIMLLDGTLIQSRSQKYLHSQVAINLSTEDRARAAASFHAWDSAGTFAHLLLAVGLGFYVLRLGQSFDRRNA
jgi:phosphoserine phosphatase